MKVKETLKWAKNSGNLMIASFKAFMEDRALTMSAALAYYTVSELVNENETPPATI